MLPLTLAACFAERLYTDGDTAIIRKDPLTDETGDSDDSASTYTPCDAPTDADADLYDAEAAGGTDCDDDDPAVTTCPDTGDDTTTPTPCTPTGVETCNGLDDDCDGEIDDPWLADAAGSTVVASTLLSGDTPAIIIGMPASKSSEDGAVEVYDPAGSLVVRIDGTGHTSSFGSVLATGRDLTGDGHVDLVIAAPYDEVDGVANRGRVWVLPGPLSASTTLADAAWTYEGGELDGQVGGQLALAPDLTGDGKPELLLGYYRYVLLFSGVTGGAAHLADATTTIELNTGGGAWAFATTPDQDLDGHDELVLGMPTYGGGAGLVATFWSTTLPGPHTEPDASLSDSTLPGLGASLVNLDGVLWSLSDGTPVRLDDRSTLALTATRMVDADGLLFSDGTRVFDAAGDEVQAGTDVENDNALMGATDLDGDGIIDLRVAGDGVAGVLGGATAWDSPCNADGDPVSSGAGDCDDTRDDVYPGAIEVCDGLDNDCDGTTDSNIRIAADVSIVGLWSVGDVDGDGLADALVQGTDGLWSTFSKSTLRTTFDFAAAAAPAGDADQDGAPELWLFGEDAALSPADALDTEDLLDSTVVRSGTVLQLGGAGGRLGDVDGDGIDDLWLLARDNLTYPWLALWSGAPPDGATLDDSSERVELPSGWTDIIVGTPAPDVFNDLTGDGRADLVVSSASSYYGFGRANVLEGGWEGTLVVDERSLLAVYGDPDEGLGTFVSLPGDLDGDGVADAWIGAADGVRRLLGSACPTFDSRVPGPQRSIVAADADGDGTREVWTSDGGTIAVDGATLTTGSAVFTTPDTDGDGLQEAWWLDGSLWRQAPTCAD